MSTAAGRSWRSGAACIALLVLLLITGVMGFWVSGRANSDGLQVDLGREHLARLSYYQRAVLRDGTLSSEEYRAAIGATIGCARAAGAVIPDPAQLDDGTFDISVSVPKDAPNGAVTAYSRCSRYFSEEIDLLWQTRAAAP